MDTEENLFGEVEYLPESGLSIRLTAISSNFQIDTDRLFGILITGEKCTIMGSFQSAQFGSQVRGGTTTRFGYFSCSFLVVDQWVPRGSLIHGVQFSFPQLLTFFYRNPDVIEYTSDPIVSVKTYEGEFGFRQRATFKPFQLRSTKLLHSLDPALVPKVVDAVEAIEAKSDDELLIRDEFSIEIVYSSSVGIPEPALYKRIIPVLAFFSLIMDVAILPDEVRTVYQVGEELLAACTFFPSWVVSAQTIEHRDAKYSYWNLPINRDQFDFSESLSKWVNNYDNFSDVAEAILNRGDYFSEYSLKSEIVLQVAQLEGIQRSMKLKDKGATKTISRFASERLLKSLTLALSTTGVEDLGKAVTDLRNEIVHLGKPRKVLPKLSFSRLSKISTCLELTVIGYVLSQIGFEIQTVEIYQDRIYVKKHLD